MKDVVITVGTAMGGVLELARSIKKEVDCKVYVLCTDLKTSDTINTSKFVNEVLYIAGESEADYINEVKNWYNNAEFYENPVLYFTTDTSCFYVSNNREWFEERFELCMPSSEIIKTYTKKGLAEISAVEAGLIVPATRVLSGEEDFAYVLSNFVFPVIIKPQATYLRNDIDFKIKVVKGQQELRETAMGLIDKGNTLLCQEYIPGDDETSFFYLFHRTEEGHVVENMGRRILQTGKEGGLMAKGLTEYNSTLSNMCKIFLDRINYVGIGGLEFKSHNNKFYFIEMNIRVEGILKIAEIANSPISLASYYYKSGEYEKIARLRNQQSDGVLYMDFQMLIGAQLKRKKYFSLFKDIINAIFANRTGVNVYSSDDPNPFWHLVKSKF